MCQLTILEHKARHAPTTIILCIYLLIFDLEKMCFLDVYQDNQSAILLEVNGKRSSSNRTRALNIRYFLITDQVESGNVSVEYCPTKSMVADFFTKPLQGELFLKFQRFIMGTE